MPKMPNAKNVCANGCKKITIMFTIDSEHKLQKNYERYHENDYS